MLFPKPQPHTLSHLAQAFCSSSGAVSLDQLETNHTTAEIICAECFGGSRSVIHISGEDLAGFANILPAFVCLKLVLCSTALQRQRAYGYSRGCCTLQAATVTAKLYDCTSIICLLHEVSFLMLE